MKKHIVSVALSILALGAIAAGCAKKDDTPDIFYTVTFVMPDGTTKDVTVKKGGSLSSEEIPAIEIEGYEGAKWSKSIFDNITSDIRVTVDKTDMKAIEYVVKYNVDGGTPLADGKVTYDAEYTLAEPTPPEGKEFSYWYNVDDLCLKNDDPSDDYKANVALTGVWKIAGKNEDKTINLKAVYEDKKAETVTVSFVQTGQKTQTIEVVKGQKITKEQWDSITVAQDPGYEKFEWDFDYENTVINEATQISLKAAVAKTFKITYDLGGEDAILYVKENQQAESNEQSVKYLENVVAYKPVPNGKYRVFVGWKVSGEDKAFANNQQYAYAKDITLVAQWRDMTDEEKKEVEKEEEKNWTGFY